MDEEINKMRYIYTVGYYSVIKKKKKPESLPFGTWISLESIGFAKEFIWISPCLFNLYAEYIMRNAGLEEAQAGIKIARKISITSDMQMTPPLWQKVKRN